MAQCDEPEGLAVGGDVPDDSWVKRVVEERIGQVARNRRAPPSRGRAPGRAAALPTSSAPAFAGEVQRALEEYRTYAGAAPVQIDERGKTSRDPDWFVALRCTGAPAMTWGLDVNTSAATGEAMWFWRGDDGTPRVERRRFTLSVEDGQLRWNGETKEPAGLVQELLEPWLRRLVMGGS